MAQREEFRPLKIRLIGETQRNSAMSLIKSLLIDTSTPIEIIIREEKNVRGLNANARMWAGPLRDIAEQGYVEGRSYSAEVWHEFFKKEFLPEEASHDLTKDGYKKWDYTPLGDRVLIGSTTKLTTKGFAQYVTQVEAFGANIGVRFSTAAVF